MNCKNLDEKKTKQIVLICTEKFFNDLNDYCEKHCTTKSKLIRKMISEKIYENN